MTLLFIADLHLQDERPELTRAFLQFLEHRASHTDGLYILGDLFEAWIGDDNQSDTISQVCGGLTRLQDAGVPVFIQHGNRDFLLGNGFAERCGAQLLAESVVIKPNNKPLLLMHGDQLCLEDLEYQRFRNQVRSPEWQQQFLAQSLAEREAIARQLRTVSREQGQQKAMEIMDVTASEVDRVMTEHNVDTLIHGHTHRPQVHLLNNDGLPRHRIVLGDWGPDAWYLQWNHDDSFTLNHYPT